RVSLPLGKHRAVGARRRRMGGTTPSADAGVDAARAAGSAPQDTIEGLLKGGFGESLFRSHFENLPGPAYIWRRVDGDYKLVACNKAAIERVRAIAKEFVIGSSATELQKGYDFVGLLDECLRVGRVRQIEIDYQ